ncbi:MAG: tRNA (guanosine(46)-N7)-methyltransferase TrmB [Verrucomicrobiales bacterium]|nr:tRNA (guanosine(46)-N7)-methyltransferase TrmB [Verrucomicrobiales bacterium]
MVGGKKRVTGKPRSLASPTPNASTNFLTLKSELPCELIPADYFRLLRPEEIFPDALAAPCEIDVGCGDGSFLIRMAEHFPDRNFLGLERLQGRVRKVARAADRLGLTNVRVLRLESSYVLGWLLPEGLATRIHLLFPDPWPKKRHHHHRFVNAENLAAIHRVLRPGGQFLFKTDHEEYFQAASGIVDAMPCFRRAWPLSDGEFYPLTDFEQQWLKQGKSIHAARWERL